MMKFFTVLGAFKLCVIFQPKKEIKINFPRQPLTTDLASTCGSVCQTRKMLEETAREWDVIDKMQTTTGSTETSIPSRTATACAVALNCFL